MANKSQYRTKQMAEILSYLQSMQGSHVTVHDIHAYFKSKNISVGTTTIYRHLDRMVAEGIVAKYVVDEKSSACFEYLGDKSHCHPTVCFHCKCEKCGKLYENTLEAVKAAGVEANIQRVEDLLDIVRLGVMSSPALMIDGKLVVAGRIAKVDEIRRLLEG